MVSFFILVVLNRHETKQKSLTVAAISRVRTASSYRAQDGYDSLFESKTYLTRVARF